MIFLIKQHWPLALLVTAVWTSFNLRCGGWAPLTSTSSPVGVQLAWGIGGALLALLINGLVHTGLAKGFGQAYLSRFDRYARDVGQGMRWPHWATGGVMAALAEEPFFRGVVVGAVDAPVPALLLSTALFGLCHWLRPRYFGFWIWALWENVLFTLLFLATGSLLVTIVAHGLHDLGAYAVFAHLTRSSSR